MMSLRRSIAGANGAAAVAFAAFGAHALPADLADRFRGAYATGAEFHLVHAVLLAALAFSGEPRNSGTAFWLLLAGSATFAASLYALALTATGAFGAITPVGGVLMIAGWLMLARDGLRRR